MDSVISYLPPDDKSFIRNDSIGFIPQSTVVISTLNVLDNICLPFFLSKREGDSIGRGRYLLKELGIEHLENSYPRELSGGELRRVTIARALMNYPKIILADEPVAALDPITAKRVMEDFRKINQELNISILLNIHHVELALEYADRIIGIRDGEIVYDGPSSQVTKEVLDLIYKGKAEELHEG